MKKTANREQEMAKGQKTAAEGPDFEKALAELEAIVKQLEAGSLSLDGSLGLFQRGIELARACKQRLDDAELKVSKLVKEKEGLFKEEEFEEKERE